MNTAIDLIEKTADLLEDGEAGPVWIRGAYELKVNDRWHYCLMGGLGKAAHCTSAYTYDAAKALILDKIGELDITIWNDREGRTAEQVISMLREIVNENRD